MAVFYKRDSGRVWSQIPVRIQKCTDDKLRGLFADAVAELNGLIGYTVVQETESDEGIKVVRVTGQGSSRSQTTGYNTDPTKNRIDVNLNRTKGDYGEKSVSENKFVIIHELLHALGFEHEQFHKRYPWDDTELPVTSALDQDDAVYAKLRVPGNQKIFNELKTAYNSGFVPVQYLASRRKNLSDTKLETNWNNCDTNSIMMYPEHDKILKAHFSAVVAQATNKVGSSNLLSAGDIQALRVIYPRA